MKHCFIVLVEPLYIEGFQFRVVQTRNSLIEDIVNETPFIIVKTNNKWERSVHSGRLQTENFITERLRTTGKRSNGLQRSMLCLQAIVLFDLVMVLYRFFLFVNILNTCLLYQTITGDSSAVFFQLACAQTYFIWFANVIENCRQVRLVCKKIPISTNYTGNQLFFKCHNLYWLLTALSLYYLGHCFWQLGRKPCRTNMSQVAPLISRSEGQLLISICFRQS